MPLKGPVVIVYYELNITIPNLRQILRNMDLITELQPSWTPF